MPFPSSRQTGQQQFLTMFLNDRIRHVVCLFQSAYYTWWQECGGDVLNLELDSLAERVTNSEQNMKEKKL